MMMLVALSFPNFWIFACLHIFWAHVQKTSMIDASRLEVAAFDTQLTIVINNLIVSFSCLLSCCQSRLSGASGHNHNKASMPSLRRISRLDSGNDFKAPGAKDALSKQKRFASQCIRQK